MTIGIIEDNRLLNQALNKFLTDNGYATVCAHSGEEAFAAAADHPDLWLIDVGRIDVGRILRTFKIKKNVEVTDNGKDNF